MMVVRICIFHIRLTIFPCNILHLGLIVINYYTCPPQFSYKYKVCIINNNQVNKSTM